MSLQFRRFSTRAQDGVSRLPARLGRWRLLEMAAQGSMARVYRGEPWYPLTDSAGNPLTTVAVKVLRYSYQHRPEAVLTIAQELAVGRQVRHPHLVPILDGHLGAAPYYVVMPWLHGDTLADRLAKKQPFAIRDVLFWTEHVLHALEALHVAGWLHGDIKPGNLWINERNQAVLIDLGFAWQIETARSSAKVPIVGTWNYMAPERVLPPRQLDIRGDLYSLGVTLFEILAGRLPFQGDNFADVARLHCECAPPALRELAPQVPPATARLVHWLMEKSPRARPQFPAAVLPELANALAEVGS